ncbi:MAG: VWA domain-containing protein [Candidatus Lokiarchaeota archaeon]|nr:VWA domain-containing protein [Candidatus Lokiarchaeota archaeon]MBD3198671.1 VWA domain-containing protein [Candidatus Lokiarchaeota archaeon]
MGVFPHDPCDFAVEFIRKMRNHPDIVQIPSSRQVLAIPRLILSRYYRKGSITPDDFIEISKVTSFPNNQKLANDLAFEVLFPNYKKDIVSDFFKSDDNLQSDEKELLNDQEKFELEELQDLIDDIEINIDSDKLEEVERFMNEVNQKRMTEPYKSALNFFKDDSELYKQQMTSLEQLMNEAKKRLEEKINSLDPEDLKAGSNLGLDDLIQKKTKRKWENLTSKALNNQDISKELEDIMNSQNLEDLIQSMKFLKDSDAIKDDLLKNLRDQLQNQIKDLDELFNAAKNLGETPKFDMDKVLNNSLQKSSFEHNFNLANSLDQYFGTNLREDLLNRFNKMNPSSQNSPSLESLTKNAFANKSWNDLFKKALQNAIKQSQNAKNPSEQFKNLAHQLNQLKNTCQNIHCGQKMSQELPEIIKKALESTKNPSQLRDNVEFLRKIGLNPNPEDIKKMGEKLNMDEDEIYELIEPDYQLLKKLIKKNQAEFERLQNLMNRLKDQINDDRLKELLRKALSAENRDALGALGHFDLNQALKAAKQTEGQEGMDKLISSLSAGSGENLLKQWFKHRRTLPEGAKEKVKELAKKMLIELGIYYSRARIGSSTTGPTPINIVRPYTVGDDFDNIDMEETIFNILEKGKKISHIDYDDFFVYETGEGLRNACIELDISGSMSGEKLTYLAICVTMLVYGMRKDELAACFFESDTHILKEMDQKIDLEELADEILSVKARGGTRIQKALEWARRQFKEKSSSREKLNIIFTDAEVYDIEDSLEELRIFRSMGIDFIIVCPESSFNLEEAERMVKITGGQLLKIKDFEEFPTLISEIIKSRF